jgi:VanZ family protein
MPQVPYRYYIPAMIWFVVLTILLVIPGSTMPKHPLFERLQIDKWVHIGLFSGLILAWTIPPAYAGIDWQKRAGWNLTIVLMAIGYGIIMEFVQDAWIPNRSFEAADMLADSAGALLGWLVSKKIWYKCQKRKPL